MNTTQVINFIVTWGPKAPLRYESNLHSGWTLEEAWNRVVEASQSGGVPIRLPEENGELLPLTFAWGADGAGGEDQLDPRIPIQDLALPEGAPVHVTALDGVGTVDEFGESALRHHRKGLFEFLQRHRQEFDLLNLLPRDFHVRIRARGVVGLDSRQAPKIAGVHEIRIIVPTDFPIARPTVRPISEIFHPNVSPKERDICFAMSWKPTRENLLAWVLKQTLAIIQYSKVAMQEPHVNMNPDAALWYKAYTKQHPDYFPLKPVLTFREEIPPQAAMRFEARL